MRINLVVPFSDKDKAKARGAKWDSQSKVWYVEDFYNDPNNVRVFLEWAPERLRKPTESKPLSHPPFVVTQPRTPRLKKKKTR
jgi:hypothetical protein